MSRFARELKKQKNPDYAQPVKVSSYSKDITDVAAVLNELSDIRRSEHIEYERAMQELSNVISGISHDFRTPLTASLGYLQMIERSGELSQRNADYLSIIISKSLFLKELSDEFFMLTKLESGNEELHSENVNLSNVLTEAILKQHEWTEQRGIAAEFDITDGITVTTDAYCLSRILNNLFSNAEKYTKDKFGVSLKKDGDKVIIRVFNTLDDEVHMDINKVFEPFYRLDSRTKDGSGLGLYIVKLLCDRLGWTVKAAIDGNIFSVEIALPF